MSWQWVQRDIVFAVHDKQLAVHGGLDGVQDLNAVESALHRAKNLNAYGNPPPDAADLGRPTFMASPPAMDSATATSAPLG